MKKIQKIYYILKHLRNVKRVLNFLFCEYLYEEGWFNSYESNQSLGQIC